MSNQAKWRGFAIGAMAILFPGATFAIGSFAGPMSGTQKVLFVLVGAVLSCATAAIALYLKRLSNRSQAIQFGENLCAIVEHLGRLAGKPDDARDLQGQTRTRALSLLARYVHPDARCAFYSLDGGNRLQRRGTQGQVNNSRDVYTATDADGSGRDLLHAVARNKVISIPDTRKPNGQLNVSLGDGYRTAIVAPVYSGEQPHGVLIMDAPKVGDLDDVPEAFVRLFSCILGVTQAAGGEMSDGINIGEQRANSPESHQSGEEKQPEG